ncbi:MAG: HPr family phosphocarrier protein [Treponema sp.]|jgi:phosphocarrier protein|nr:HPr family phosphocarrier protein [Treponema sp.]
MAEISYTLTDPLGIHARPAGLFVKALGGFTSAITISRGADSCDGKKLIALMKLRVKQGETITVKADGDDADAAVKAAEDFLKANL